ncbi:MAG: hypothetical protein ABR886_02625 [Dehalococcoidales bacterium]|jgi:hypothetical protein
MSDISQNSAQLAGQGMKVLAELMKKEGLLKFDQNGNATAYSNELFQKAISLWIQEYRKYIQKLDNLRKNDLQMNTEVAELVVSQLPKSRLP